jgi:hypothetical protein
VSSSRSDAVESTIGDVAVLSLLIVLWIAVVVWVLMTLNAIRRNTARTVELLEQQAKSTSKS